MKFLSVLLMAVGLASTFVLSTYLGRLYEHTRPTYPDPTAGLIHELHPIRGGRTVYVSKAEYWLYFGSWTVGILFGITDGALYQDTKHRPGGAA
jgi:hypothetical protein